MWQLCCSPAFNKVGDRSIEVLEAMTQRHRQKPGQAIAARMHLPSTGRRCTGRLQVADQFSQRDLQRGGDPPSGDDGGGVPTALDLSEVLGVEAAIASSDVFEGLSALYAHASQRPPERLRGRVSGRAPGHDCSRGISQRSRQSRLPRAQSKLDMFPLGCFNRCGLGTQKADARLIFRLAS